MYSFTALALATQILVWSTNAQNDTSNSTKSCSDLEDVLKYNSTTSQIMQALELNTEHPVSSDPGTRYFLLNDTSRTWQFTLRVQPMSTGGAGPDFANYRQTMFLDTGGSDTTDIGSCHQTLSVGKDFHSFDWTKETLERSLNAGNGDCTSILGDECVQAIKKKAAYQAANWPLRIASCGRMNNSLPPECSSFGPQLTTTRQMNLTYLDGISNGNSNSDFDRGLDCNGTAVSSTHSVPIAEGINYENAIRFPVIDIVTFWPNRTSGLTSYFTGWENDVHVEVVCMRPDLIRPGSNTPRNGSEILNERDARFRPANGAGALKAGLLGWTSVVVMGIMLVL